MLFRGLDTPFAHAHSASLHDASFNAHFLLSLFSIFPFVCSYRKDSMRNYTFFD